MDLSVVIPLFNKGPYIRRALEASLHQAKQPREIIVVDDGSTDDGAAIVESIHSPLVRLIRQTNAGVSAARNVGIDACQSPWVALLDADDEWDPEFLASLGGLIDRHEDLVCAGTDFRNDHGDAMVGPIPLNDEKVEDFFDQSLRRGIPVLTPSAVAVRRNALAAAGGFPVGCSSMEDIDTWMRLAWTGSIGFVPKPLVAYHQNVPGSASAKFRRDPVLPIMIETHERWLAENRIPARLRDSSERFARHWLFQFARHLIFHGRGDEARSLLQRFDRLCLGDIATARKLVARSRIPQAIPNVSRRIKSALGVYRKPEFF